MIFCGSGTTAAIDKLVGILGIRLPADLDHRHQLSAQIPREQRPVVFIGPYEHHSNELPWRESIGDVVDDPRGRRRPHRRRASWRRARAVRRPAAQDRLVQRGQQRDRASSPTRTAITRLLHEHGALALWDVAAAAPYVDIEMNPHDGDPAARKDALFMSPHKFIGGPGTPGVLVVSRRLLTNSVPDVVGGGTVSYVNPQEHRYILDPAHREEGGTPAIVESIRAGLVFALKDAVGVATIRAHEEDFLRRAVTAWREHPAIEVLGNPDAERLSIVSFVIRRPAGRYLHHNLVVSILNDLFGIQSRGGCSCAGPYGHRLLGIDLERSHEFEREITGGCEGIKPGWVRINFNYFVSEPVFEYVVRAVALVADHGHKLAPQYRFDPMTGLWQHRAGPVEPPLRLTHLSYDADGVLTYPREHDTAPESALAGYLSEAVALFESLPEVICEDGVGDRVSADFEHLRWFDLPAECLEPSPVDSSAV